MQTNIQFPDTSEIDIVNKQLILQTEGKKITCAADLEWMTDTMKGINRRIKVVEEKMAEPISLANKTHKALTSLRAELLAPLERAKQYAAREIARYDGEQRRIAQEAAMKAKREADEARRIAEEEERKRLEAERLETAMKLEKIGFKEEADQILDQPIIVQTPPNSHVAAPLPDPEPFKPKGLTIKTTYRAEVTDLRLLVQEVAAGRQPLSLILPNEKKLNDLAKTLKHELTIPGIQVVEDSKAQTREYKQGNEVEAYVWLPSAGPSEAMPAGEPMSPMANAIRSPAKGP